MEVLAYIMHNGYEALNMFKKKIYYLFIISKPSIK
jgi:hypothetical protein